MLAQPRRRGLQLEALEYRLNLSAGLVAAYNFDQGSGSVLTDISGNGHTGSIVNATWSTVGKYGDALSFNGTNALVNIPDATSLHLTTGMTLEAWVKPTAAANGWQDVIFKGNDNYYLESSSPTGAPVAGGTVGSSDSGASGTSVLPTNTWSFLTETYNGTTILLYVNGVQVAALALSGSLATSTDQLQIAGDSLYGQYFQGLIDNIRIYNGALTAAEIQDDMNTPVAAGTPPPTAPANLTAVASGNTITLNWTTSQDTIGVSSYVVERENPGSTSFVQIGTATGTTYSDTGLTSNSTYSYELQAVDWASNQSAVSNVASATAQFGINPNTSTTFLQPGQTQQFTANATGVIWSVNGVVGGSASTGTITSMGLYTAPNSVGSYTVMGTTTDGMHSASASVNVTNYSGTFTDRNDNMRTGANLDETILTPTNVNSSTFGKLFSYPLDGIAFASPLYVPHIDIPGIGYHNVVIVATENDSVYAFDADGLSTTPLWQVSFIDPTAGITPIPAADTLEPVDIPNEVGITGTPVIDPTTGTLYLVADTKVVANGTTTYYQTLHALDITTGAAKFGGPVVIQATVPGTGSDSVNGMVTFNPLYQNQHSGLLLSNGVVYIAFSSHGDDYPDWHGWVFGYNASTLRQVMVYNDTANGNGGGIWMGTDGLAADSTGDIYFTTGNGDFNANSGGIDYGDSTEKISPSGTVVDYFTPFDQATLNNDDLDLASGGVLLLPTQSGSYPDEMVFAGKGGTVYVVNRDNMGHYSANNNNQIIQSLPNIFPAGNSMGNYSSPVYYNGNVYFAPVDGTVQAFSLTNGLLSTAPTSNSAESYGYPGGMMAISANGATNGILWVVEDTGETTPGVLHAYLATNLSDELYNSNQSGSRDTMDLAAKFSMPAVANGKVYVGGCTQLTVYGLLTPDPPSPGGAIAASQIQARDAPLSAGPVTFTATTAATFTGTVATFTDADPLDTAGKYTATIEWGDGATSAGTVSANSGASGFVVTGSHAYASPGTDSVTVVILDSGGATATSNGRAMVAALPPVANPDTFVLSQNGSNSGSGAMSVLANDTSADGQQQNLVATLVSNATHGSLTLNPNGSFTYTPNSTFQGIDRFTYQVSEGTAIGNTVTVTLLSYHASLVDKLYHQVLQRSAEDAGLESWTSMLDQGASLDVVAKGIFTSPERLDPLVTQFYENYLGRAPDSGGLSAWVSDWQQKGDSDDVVVNILASQEFFNDADGTNQGFVELLYERFLGRAGEASGVSSWVGMLNSGQTRQQVASDFVGAPERHVELVDYLFGEYFKGVTPTPDPTPYVNLLNSGETQTQVELKMINSLVYSNAPPEPAVGKVGSALYPH